MVIWGWAQFSLCDQPVHTVCRRAWAAKVLAGLSQPCWERLAVSSDPTVPISLLPTCVSTSNPSTHLQCPILPHNCCFGQALRLVLGAAAMQPITAVLMLQY